MTPFLKSLLAGGPGYTATANGNVVSVRPISHDEPNLIAFQPIVNRIRDAEGDGFVIHIEHPTSDTAIEYIDMMVLQIEPA